MGNLKHKTDYPKSKTFVSLNSKKAYTEQLEID